MFKKVSLWALALTIPAIYNAAAMPDEEIYTACLKKALTDKQNTQCMEQEIKAIERDTRQQEQELARVEAVTNYLKQQNQTLSTLRSGYMEYGNSYCRYYVSATKGNGYSDEYNKARCMLDTYLLYYRDILSLYELSITDYVG